jgi:hypothetical protein
MRKCVKFLPSLTSSESQKAMQCLAGVRRPPDSAIRWLPIVIISLESESRHRETMYTGLVLCSALLVLLLYSLPQPRVSVIFCRPAPRGSWLEHSKHSWPSPTAPGSTRQGGCQAGAMTQGAFEHRDAGTRWYRNKNNRTRH